MKNFHIQVFSRNSFSLETDQPTIETFLMSLCVLLFKPGMHKKQKVSMLTTCKAVIKDTQHSPNFDVICS